MKYGDEKFRDGGKELGRFREHTKEDPPFLSIMRIQGKVYHKISPLGAGARQLKKIPKLSLD